MPQASRRLCTQFALLRTGTTEKACRCCSDFAKSHRSRLLADITVRMYKLVSDAYRLLFQANASYCGVPPMLHTRP